MAKSINIPEDYTVDNTNNLGTMTLVSGDNYNGTNITISDVKNKIGATTYDLGSLAVTSLVNKWAYFQSSVWDTENSDYMNGVYIRKPNPNGYDLGAFIGYNHNANPPVYWYTEPPSSIEIEIFKYFSLSCKLARGEGHPISNAGMESKDNIDFEYQMNNGAKSHIYRSLLSGVGLPTTFSLSENITSSGTLHLRPYYYEQEPDMSDKLQLAMIEDGARDIAVSIVNPKFSGSLAGPSTGMFGESFNFLYSITRTDASGQNLYFRLRAFSGAAVNNTKLLGTTGYLSFSGNQTREGSASLYISSTQGGQDVFVSVFLECSNSTSFSTRYTIANTSIIMSGAGGGV